MPARLHVPGALGALLLVWITACGGPTTAVAPDPGDTVSPGEDPEPFTFLPPLLPFYSPPHVDGDREFDGHGPDVTVVIDLHVLDEDKVYAFVHVEAKETRWDWTRASGTAAFLLHHSPRPIVSIDSLTRFEHRYRDTDHARDVFDFPAESSLVKTLTCVGDTLGREAGARTGCSAELHPVTILLDP